MEQAIGRRIVRLGQVDLVEHRQHGNLALLEGVEQAQLQAAEPRLGQDQDGQLGALQHLHRPLDPLGAQRADVVDARGVDEEHGAERQELHRFLHRIGGGAGLGRDDRHLLARQGVEQRGLADVAPAEDADVQTNSTRCRVHSVSLPRWPSWFTRPGDVS